MDGHFLLVQDKETGRKFWYGGEDSWKDDTEIGDENGTLILKAEYFNVGTRLEFHEDDEGEEQNG